MIIKRCKGKIIRAAQAGTLQGGHRPERHFIGVAEDGRRELPSAAEKFVHGTLTVIGVAVARLHDIAAIDVEPGFSHPVA